MREPIFTDRLVLRDITVGDAELLYELDADPEVMRCIGISPLQDLQSYRERIRTVYLLMQSHAWQGIWIVEDRAARGFLGWVFARPADQAMFGAELGWTKADEVEVGFRYHQKAWGQGFATEAATALVDKAIADPATSAVVACALAENAGSLRVLEKLGLKRVGQVTIKDEHAPTIKLARSI